MGFVTNRDAKTLALSKGSQTGDPEELGLRQKLEDQKIRSTPFVKGVRSVLQLSKLVFVPSLYETVLRCLVRRAAPPTVGWVFQTV